MDERSLRVGEAIEESGADWAILTSFDSICYATGHVVPIEAGPSPFAGGPTTAIIAKDGGSGLIVSNVEEEAASSSDATVVRTYEGFGFEGFAPVHENYVAAVAGLVREMGVGGILAVESDTFTATLRDIFEGVVSRYVDISPSLRRARATKTPGEIELLRECARITAIGQRRALEVSMVGRTELAVFSDIRCAMEEAAGQRLPLTGDFISGVDRTAAFTGWPIDRTIESGDPIICDLAPRVSGYWGDSCNTLMAGEPNAEFVRQYEAAKSALAHAVEVIRPGITAGELDAEVRGVVKKAGFDYPHHTGHAVGASVHEFPRLVPEETFMLAPDMVLMIEPGAYVPEVGGVRLEWMVQVTERGSEVLSPYEHVLESNAA